MLDEKLATDAGTVVLGLSGLALWHYAQIGFGAFMLLGGAALLIFRIYLAHKENQLLNLEIERAKRNL